jgi:hypothetical protein
MTSMGARSVVQDAGDLQNPIPEPGFRRRQVNGIGAISYVKPTL